MMRAGVEDRMEDGGEWGGACSQCECGGLLDRGVRIVHTDTIFDIVSYLLIPTFVLYDTTKSGVLKKKNGAFAQRS